MAERRLVCVDMGIVPYRDALALQEKLVAAIADGESEEHLLFVEHPSVVTAGRSATSEDMLAADRLRANGVDVVEISRGGQLTYHGPGQLVGYPLLRLEDAERDLHQYIRNVEQALMNALTAIGARAERVEGKTGVWIAQMKVASIGVAVRRWVTWHGFALNITTDPTGFDGFSPCGLKPDDIGSLVLSGFHVERDVLMRLIGDAFGAVFARETSWREDVLS